MECAFEEYVRMSVHICSVHALSVHVRECVKWVCVHEYTCTSVLI